MLMNWIFISLTMVIAFVARTVHSDSSSHMPIDGNPYEWAVKWNGIGKSNNPGHAYAQSWKGTGISAAEKAKLISKIESQPASEVYNALLSRPSPKVSYYGTCMVGIVRRMPTFWVYGMYGSHGHLGYPKNPISGDGTGHLQGCHNEHQVTGLCSYSDVADRAKQTLLYAVQNDVCTDYYNLRDQLEEDSQPESSDQVKQTNNTEDRATKFLTQIGLTIPPVGKGAKWITLCEVKAQVRQSGSRQKSDERTCKKTISGEIKETRVIVRTRQNCIYNAEICGSGKLLSHQKNLVNQYKYGIKLSMVSNDKSAADYIESMKNQHLKNLQTTNAHDSAKLTALATSASGREGHVNELF